MYGRYMRISLFALEFRWSISWVGQKVKDRRNTMTILQLMQGQGKGQAQAKSKIKK